MNARVSEKGQVTIPKRLRERLGIRPGETLDFEEQDGRLVATKLTVRDAADEVFGILGRGLDTDAELRRLRGEADAV
jgi:AbrB family looped-hinge helix DNA binding protein